jgi:hypothetical protein
MKYEDISPVIASDNLFCEVTGSTELGGALGAYILLDAQGLKFRVIIGPVEGDGSALRAEYARVCEEAAAGRIEQGALDRMWQESEIFARKVDFVLALQRKGFRIPAELQGLN